jgi:hypothetical protein
VKFKIVIGIGIKSGIGSLVEIVLPIENPEGIQLLWKTPDTQLFLSTHAGKKARRI